METPQNWSWAQLDLTRQLHRNPEELAAEEAARIEALKEQAYLKGLEEGTSQGRTQARQQLAAALEIARQATDAVQEAQEEWAAHLEANLAAVSMAIARKLVEREFEVDPEILAALVASGLTHFPSDQRIRIRVNPRDLASVHSADGGEASISGTHQARWVGDESVPRGGFILEGPERVLDGRTDMALERLYRSMTDA